MKQRPGCKCLACHLKALRAAFGGDLEVGVLVQKRGAVIYRARLLDADAAEEYDEALHHATPAKSSTVFRPPGVG